MAKKGGMWHLNYQIKSGVGVPEDKFEVNVHRSKKGVHMVANAGIPELSDEQMDKLEAAMKKYEDAMDDADASDLAQHVKSLRMVAEYCDYVANIVEGNA